MDQAGADLPGPTGVSDLMPLLAVSGLPGASAEFPEISPSVAFSIVTTARSSRLTGPLLAAVRAGSLHLPGDAEELLVDAHRAALVSCMRLEQRLLEVDAALSARDIPFVVLKGPAVAHLDLADPGERAWSDVDILVPPDHLDRAVAVLVESGAIRVYPEPRPGWDRRFGKSVELRGEDRIEIDVHRTLADGVYGNRIPLDHLHATTDTFELGGSSLRALSAPARVLHAAYHAVVGSVTPTWTNRRDLASYFSHGHVPVADVVDEAKRWRGEAVLAAAVELVRTELPLDCPEWFAWADSYAVDRHEQLLVSRLRHGDAGAGRARLDLVRELPSMRDRIDYLTALALPTEAQDSVLARYRRWLPHLLRRRGTDTSDPGSG